MEPAILIAGVAGALAGLLATALPGVHVNLLAVAVLALAPASGGSGAAFLVGALSGAPFGLALASTFLGAGDESTLPAHQLAREGRGAEAVALQAWGAFAGLVLALGLAALAAPALLLVEPWARVAMPWLVVGVIVALALVEPARPRVHRRWIAVAWPARRLRGTLAREGPGWRVGGVRLDDPHALVDARREGDLVELDVEPLWTPGPLSRAAGIALAASLLATSGALGAVALRMGAASPWRFPASALLPLLAGLFAAPSLLLMLRQRGGPMRARLRAPRPPRGELLRRAMPGALASSLLGLVPGVSPSHVAHLAPRSDRPERALVTLGAVNGGAVVFCLLAWHVLGKARQGGLVAAQALDAPLRWRGFLPPPELIDEAALVLAGAALACLAARALAAPLARLLARAPPGWLGAGGLALVLAAVVATTGAWGVAVLAVAAAVGLVPIRLGLRRSLLMGCILVPVALRLWGLG